MSDINRVQLANLKQHNSDFTNEKDNYQNSTRATFSNGYISTCSDSTVVRMRNRLKDKYFSIGMGYNQIYSWWNDYIENLEAMENYLADNGSLGNISNSSLRNEVDKLVELREFKPEFASFVYKEVSNSDIFNEVKGNNIKYEESVKHNAVNDSEKINLSANVSAFFSGMFGSVTSFFKDTSAKISSNAESAWTSIGNWWNNTTDNVGEFFSDTGAKISSSTSSLFAEKEESLKHISNNIADISNDKNGLFEKSTVIDNNGTRLEFDKREEKEDGTVIYYDESGDVIKQVNSDGTATIYGISPNNTSKVSSSSLDKTCITYYEDGSYSISQNSNQREFQSGYIKYYDKDGNEYKVENYNNLDIKKPENANLYSYTIKENGVEQTYKDGYLSSYSDSDKTIKYNSDGNIIFESFLDGTKNEYYDNGVIKEKYLDSNNYTKYNEDGSMSYQEIDGKTTYELYDNGNVKTETINGVTIDYHKDGSYWGLEDATNEGRASSSDGWNVIKGDTVKIVDSDGNVKIEILSDGTANHYWYNNKGEFSSTTTVNFE